MDGAAPALGKSSSLWVMATGSALTGAQLAALFGHVDPRFGGLTERGALTLLGNSMHLAEVRAPANVVIFVGLGVHNT